MLFVETLKVVDMSSSVKVTYIDRMLVRVTVFDKTSIPGDKRSTYTKEIESVPCPACKCQLGSVSTPVTMYTASMYTYPEIVPVMQRQHREQGKRIRNRVHRRLERWKACLEVLHWTHAHPWWNAVRIRLAIITAAVGG